MIAFTLLISPANLQILALEAFAGSSVAWSALGTNPGGQEKIARDADVADFLIFSVQVVLLAASMGVHAGATDGAAPLNGAAALNGAASLCGAAR